MGKIFSKEELYDRKPRVYKRDASQVRFLLGGIGTGNFSVDARGKFLDWEIFNWPAKNTKFPLSFFAIRVENEKWNSRYRKYWNPDCFRPTPAHMDICRQSW